MDLVKDGNGVTSFGYYQELLFRKHERGEDVAVRSTEFDGLKIGKLISVGFDKFQIREYDGDIATIKISSLLDVS